MNLLCLSILKVKQTQTLTKRPHLLEINLRKLVTFKSPRGIRQNLDTVVPIFNLQHPTNFRLKLTPEDPQLDYKVHIKADKKHNSGEIVITHKSYN